jgi:membrane protease YdiL (CAAX protease family)
MQSLALGALAVGLFSAGAVAVAQVPELRAAVDSVLDHARFSSLPVVAVITLVNGLAEEMFFRGALYAAIGVQWPVLISTGLYGLTTVASGNSCWSWPRSCSACWSGSSGGSPAGCSGR